MKRMYKTCISVWLQVTFFVVSVFPCFSQNVQAEINDHVWRKQLKGMNELDSDLFLSVMSRDVVQISYDRKTIRNYEQFSKLAKDSYQRMKEQGLLRTVEFRFLERISNGVFAYENGYVKYEVTNNKGETNIFYGAFQVVLRKEAGVWKVLVDYDSNTYGGAAVTANLFDAAKLLESFE
jgi:ketosteroid isomerase-like protein